LNLSMPAGKLAADAGRDIPGSTMVVAMARNGTEFGIQVSGTGDDWFCAPAPAVKGLYFSGFGAEDAGLDIGDSTITETTGIGGFAMAAAPAIVLFVGGEVSDALDNTLRMYEITLAEHPFYKVPILGFRGTPTGIDTMLVVRSGVLPCVNTGIAGSYLPCRCSSTPPGPSRGKPRRQLPQRSQYERGLQIQGADLARRAVRDPGGPWRGGQGAGWRHRPARRHAQRPVPA
jgi:hypothetical protein